MKYIVALGAILIIWGIAYWKYKRENGNGNNKIGD